MNGNEITSARKIDEIRSYVSSRLSGDRLSHVFSVEKEALCIAKYVFPIYNIGNEHLRDVSAASLLHDATKNLTLSEQLGLCEKYGIDTGDFPSCAVLHSKTAAYLSRELFGINNDVFSAIYCHTTGRENMSVLDKIIFIADYIEPTRAYEECKKARDYFYANVSEGSENNAETLDKTIIMSLDGTIRSLIAKNRPIDVQTILTRNYFFKTN
jgi:nicotinate-nucleotide adenylyltransferase